MTKFIEAYAKSTGKKQVIPAAWLDIDQAPFNDFQKTPSRRAKDKASPATDNNLPAKPDNTKEG